MLKSVSPFWMISNFWKEYAYVSVMDEASGTQLRFATVHTNVNS